MSSVQLFPSSPARPDTPNRHDHPYLIRTTSSSLLTRSNSIGSVHRPASPITRTPASPALGRSQGRGHKYSKSHSAIGAPPLPLPPSTPTSPTETRQFSPSKRTPGRVKRSETVPSFSTSSPHPSPKVEDLPTNPKLWTSTHLASYLSSALRVKGGGVLPKPVIKDIATFIVDRQLSGRTFLRLTADDLGEMGINQLWRDALLNASRTLRSNVLQGRIWGFGSSNDFDMPSFPSTVFEENRDTRGDIKSISRGTLSRAKSGQVKDIIAGFERSASSASSDSGAEPDSPFSSTSELSGSFQFPPFLGNVLVSGSEDEGSAVDHDIFVNESITGVLYGDEANLTATMETSPLPDSSEAVVTGGQSDEESAHAIVSTPPPMYAVEASLQEASVATELQPSNISSSVQQAEPMKHLSHDSGSEDTMENLVANFTHTSSASWGAKAWEEVDELEPGSTRRKINEAHQRISSNGTDVGLRSSSSHGPPAGPSNLVALFDPPPPLPITRIQELDAEVRERDRRNQVLLFELTSRLEEVERRLDEMETREKELARPQHMPSTTATGTIPVNSSSDQGQEVDQDDEARERGNPTPQQVPEQSSPSQPMAELETEIPVSKEEAKSLISTTSTMATLQKPANLPTTIRNSHDPTAAGLPGYVLLVSLGVCAVILRVMMKRMAGRKG